MSMDPPTVIAIAPPRSDDDPDMARYRERDELYEHVRRTVHEPMQAVAARQDAIIGRLDDLSARVAELAARPSQAPAAVGTAAADVAAIPGDAVEPDCRRRSNRGACHYRRHTRGGRATAREAPRAARPSGQAGRPLAGGTRLMPKFNPGRAQTVYERTGDWKQAAKEGGYRTADSAQRAVQRRKQGMTRGADPADDAAPHVISSAPADRPAPPPPLKAAAPIMERINPEAQKILHAIVTALCSLVNGALPDQARLYQEDVDGMFPPLERIFLRRARAANELTPDHEDIALFVIAFAVYLDRTGAIHAIVSSQRRAGNAAADRARARNRAASYADNQPYDASGIPQNPVAGGYGSSAGSNGFDPLANHFQHLSQQIGGNRA